MEIDKMMLLKKVVCTLVVAGLGLVGASSAMAQDAPAEKTAKVKGEKRAEKKAEKKKLKLKAFAGCKNDVKKHCSEVEPGEGRLRACLGEHSAELDKKCVANTARYDKRQEFKAACAEDVKTHCGAVKAGKGRIAKCLKGAEASLSAVCKAKFPADMSAADVKEINAFADEIAPEVVAPVEGDAAIEANP
jgi:hypothetical protein